MKLSSLLERLEVKILQGNTDVEITGIACDSREAGSGSLFVCIVGAKTDGHRYLADAAQKGAAAVMIQKGTAVDFPKDITVIEAEDTRYALALASAAWYGYPAELLPVIGVTGTKGKTTTTYLVRSILQNAGYEVGLIGTIETVIKDRSIPSEHTTPESIVIQRYLREMIDAGCSVAVMEVSSQALMLHRTAGIPFRIGVFTNLSPDHIGPAEHTSFEDYLHCKSLLFRQCELGILNADDPYMEAVLEGHTCEVMTYGIGNPAADLRAAGIEHLHRPGYLGVSFRTEGAVEICAELDIPGKFSVYNALAAIAICSHFKIRNEDIQRALKCAKVKGRIEMVKVSDRFTLMIDYAHNAMALESLLLTLRDYHPHRIVCVFGCGGNRARSRRFEMGEVSGRLADLTVITSDNPRYEEPQAIIDDIKTGMAKTDGKYVEIIDRREAIAWAIDHGEPGDVIVLAGKGHEDYQEICGKKYPMDERVIIADLMKERAK